MELLFERIFGCSFLKTSAEEDVAINAIDYLDQENSKLEMTKQKGDDMVRENIKLAFLID